MAMTWTTLTADKNTDGSIKQWLNDSGVPSSTIIVEAESFIYRRLRHRLMVNDSTTGSMVIGQDFITLPTDHLDTRNLVITGGALWGFSPLTKKILEEVQSRYCYDGTGARVNQQPEIYYTNATQVKFDSPPDQAYTYLFSYFAQPVALGASNTTNFVTVTYPRLMRCACMYFGAEWTKDSGQGNYDRSYWEGEAEKEIVIAQAESDREETADINGPIFV